MISIVTVTFNDLPNLKITYESLIKQKNNNFEWIIIDGNSNDGTINFLSTLTFSKMHFISEKDNGLYDAMNKGIERLNGNYVLFLNAGDALCKPDTLIKVNTILEEKRPDFLYGDSIEVSVLGESFYRKSRPLWWKALGMFTHHQAMFYKINIIREFSLKYDNRLSIGADYDFTLSFLKNSSKHIYLGIPICNFLQGGLSHKNWKKGIKQQSIIRNNYMKLNFIHRNLIYYCQYLLHLIRFNFTFIYNFYRFKKTQK